MPPGGQNSRAVDTLSCEGREPAPLGPRRHFRRRPLPGPAPASPSPARSPLRADGTNPVRHRAPYLDVLSAHPCSSLHMLRRAKSAFWLTSVAVRCLSLLTVSNSNGRSRGLRGAAGRRRAHPCSCCRTLGGPLRRRTHPDASQVCDRWQRRQFAGRRLGQETRWSQFATRSGDHRVHVIPGQMVVRGRIELPTFRFSGGFASPGASTTVQLTGSYDVLGLAGVQDRPHVSRAVVSNALARSAMR